MIVDGSTGWFYSSEGAIPDEDILDIVDEINI